MPKAKTAAQKKKLAIAYRICNANKKIRTAKKKENCVYDIYYSNRRVKKSKRSKKR